MKLCEDFFVELGKYVKFTYIPLLTKFPSENIEKRIMKDSCSYVNGIVKESIRIYLVDYIQLVLIDLLYKLEEVVAFKYSLISCLFEGENGPLRGPPWKTERLRV